MFTAVADELGHLIGAEATFVSRVDPPGPARSSPGALGTLATDPSGEGREPERHTIVVGSYGRVRDEGPIGFRIRLQPGMASTAAIQTRHPARINGEKLANGPFGAIVGKLGMRAAIATPIVVEGRYWG